MRKAHGAEIGAVLVICLGSLNCMQGTLGKWAGIMEAAYEALCGAEGRGSNGQVDAMKTCTQRSKQGLQGQRTLGDTLALGDSMGVADVPAAETAHF